jgi:hypothetical protein
MSCYAFTQVRPQHVRLSMRVNEAYDMDFYYAQVNIFLKQTFLNKLSDFFSNKKYCF